MADMICEQLFKERNLVLLLLFNVSEPDIPALHLGHVNSHKFENKA